MAISKALQTLHKRQMSDPQRTTPVATDHNRRLFETTMKVCSDTASRLSSLPARRNGRRKARRSPDRRNGDGACRNRRHRHASEYRNPAGLPEVAVLHLCSNYQ
jgi:hypothetical protein